MIQRYLGNKNKIVSSILEVVENHVNPGELVADIFSGSLTVSLALKNAGYRVISNDINLFSFYVATAYLQNNSIPRFSPKDLIGNANVKKFSLEAENRLGQHAGKEGFISLDDESVYGLARDLYIILLYLENIVEDDLSADSRKSYIYDNYTAEGQNSSYRSSRGSRGKRKFFSPSNGKKIDAIMNCLRFWWKNESLELKQFSILISTILRSVEKVSNTQGTYHDFPRNGYDPRALKDLIIEFPKIDHILLGRQDHVIGRETDSLEFIKTAPPHKLLYLDPPYNFRQYTAYYFLLNMLCRYHEISDLETYFNNLSFVRGQNMDYDFSSSFNSKQKFIPSLRQLIEDAKTEYVLLSYFDGKNHWGEFKTDNNSIGYSMMLELFNTNLFVENSLKTIQLSRLNYQSYGGHSARKVTEYLFLAKKA